MPAVKVHAEFEDEDHGRFLQIQNKILTWLETVKYIEQLREIAHTSIQDILTEAEWEMVYSGRIYLWLEWKRQGVTHDIYISR